MSNFLVSIFGWPATLVHGDTMVADRWFWLRQRLPFTRTPGENVLDIGCGSGAFTMGAARRGFEAVGLSWDERNQAVAISRAKLLGLDRVSFPVCDVRRLDERAEFLNKFDIALCFENIEHIIDDRKLMKDIFCCLKPGGRLYLSTPNYYYHPLSSGDCGPFRQVEDGGHVRRGYTPAMLRELCNESRFDIEEIGYISYYFSQRTTALLRATESIAGPVISWALIFPMRVLSILLDGWLGKWISLALGQSGYSIALVAYKKRF
jgi:2-polyprenyl-3-methyl-5-hydroxy-6-metoxy-1,4-benzoquinol methylase